MDPILPCDNASRTHQEAKIPLHLTQISQESVLPSLCPSVVSVGVQTRIELPPVAAKKWWKLVSNFAEKVS